MTDTTSSKKYLFPLPILFMIGLGFLLWSCRQESIQPSVSDQILPQYVGKETCFSCHTAAYKQWEGSDHDLAMDIATDSTVLGDFNNASLKREDQTHRCFKKDNRFFVLTDGEDGTMKEYEVKYVLGYSPLQNYLVEFPGGRLQTLALTWNTLKKNWFYMTDTIYKEENVHHNNWLHWTNQAQNWNSMCAYCHSTNLEKKYVPEEDAYHTTWSEIDVSCEACHGPASKHVAWANNNQKDSLKNYGLITQTSHIDNRAFVEICARCHARRGTMNDYKPENHNIFNHYIPSLPIEPHYFIDGQIREEDYVYGSFLQSKMYLNDVQCNNCHNVHSGKLLFDDNRLCLQCHQPETYDTSAHHFHKTPTEIGLVVTDVNGELQAVGSGSLCINCHMPGAYFMGVDYRRDHSFRIPRPDLSDELGTPNACTQCHGNKSNTWATKQLTAWFGTPDGTSTFGETFHGANHSEQESNNVVQLINDSLRPLILRSSALAYLNSNNIVHRQLIYTYLNKPEVSLRLAALQALPLASSDDVQRVYPLLNDSTLAVRIEAAIKLSALNQNDISPQYQASFNHALEDYKQVQLYNLDFPTGKYNLGYYYLQKKDFQNAEKYYLLALEQDDELHAIRLSIAYLYNQTENVDKAKAYFSSYLEKVPDDGFAQYDYGLLLAEHKDYKQALTSLLKAKQLLPNHNRVDYNIALLYDYFGDEEKAENLLTQAINTAPKEMSRYMNLVQFYADKNQPHKLKPLVEKMLVLFPNDPTVQQLKTW